MNKFKIFVEQYKIEVALFMIILLGIGLRFYGLTIQSYWVDELFTLFSANPSSTLLETLERIFDDLVHPPVYNVSLWLWFNIFGFTEFSGRSFSAFTGSLSIIAIYFLGKEVANKNVGIYAALLVSINYFLVYFSQEARSYSLMFLLAVMSYLYLFKALRTQKKLDVSFYILFTILLIYTHYFGFFLAGSQFFIFLYYFILEKNRKQLIKIGLVTAIIIGASTIPILYYILNNSSEISSERMAWCPAPTADFFISYFRTYFASRYLSMVFFALLLYLIIIMYLKKSTNIKIIVSLIIWIVISYFLPYIKSILSDPILTPRYTIGVLPAIIVMIAMAINAIQNNKIRNGVLALIIFLSLFHFIRHEYYVKPLKEEWKKVTQHVIKDVDNYPIYTEYIGFMNTGHYNTYFKILESNKKALSIEALSYQLKNGKAPKRFWIINGHSKSLLPTKLIEKYSLKKLDEIKGLKTIGVLYER